MKDKDWASEELDKIVRSSETVPSEVLKKQVIDLVIKVVEQESFVDPDTKEQTFYTEQLVERLRNLVS